MKKQLISASAVACLALAGTSLPAAADLPVTINAGAGYWFFDRDLFGLEVDNEATPFIGLEYALDDNWAAEVLYADTETNLQGGPDADVATWQVGMLYYGGTYQSSESRIRPYAAFGAGEIDIDAGSFDTVETTLNAGFGVRWMLNDRIGIRLETRAVHSLDEEETDLLTSAGLNFYLGDVEPEPAPEPEPVDSDGDGVTDDKDRCPDTPAGTKVDANGCALAAARVASVKLKVNFGYDSTDVQEQYFSDLSELAAFLKRFGQLQVDVEGHTDSQGSEDYNQDLSQRRAQAVVDYLVSEHGIDASRLEAKGYGESQPVASNDTEEGRAENRRVMATLEVQYEE